MGKVVGKVLTAVGVVAGVILTGGALVGAISGAAFGGVTVAGLTLSAATLQAVAAIGILGGGLLSGTPQVLEQSIEQDQGGQQLRLTGDPTLARQVLFGKAATGGNLVYRANTGTKGQDLHLVIALAGHEVESIESFKFGPDTVTFSSNNAVGDYNNFLYLYEYLGTDSQTANTNLVSASAEWTTAHRLRGIAYVYVKAVWDQEVFPSGLLPILVTLKGAKVYDPRKDTTNGGSGSHRYATPSTWEWSENPALCAATYMLGIQVNGEVIAGMNIDGARIDWDSVTTAANICEESVDLNGGGSEDRYTCNGWINPEKSHRDNLSTILSACGGGAAFQGGKWHITAAAAVTAVETRTGDQIKGAKNFTAKKSTRDLYNGVKGRFADPSADYNLAEYPPRLVSSYVTNDGGEERYLELDFPMTKTNTMAQRLAKIALERSRMQLALPARFSPAALVDTVNDTINFTYTPFNMTAQKMRVADWALVFEPTESGVSLEVEEMLIEEDDAIYDWDETTDELTYVGVTAAPDGDMLNIVSENWYDVATNKNLPAEIKIDQGDGVLKFATMGAAIGSANDGDAITFTTAWDSSNLPEIEFYSGGLAYDSGGTLTGDQVQSFKAVNVSTTGFTAELKLQGTATTITSHTDTGATETSTDVWEMHKSQTAEAWDDNYTFQIDVTLGSVDYEGFWEPATTVFGIYTNDGGGYVQAGTLSLTSDGGTASNTALNQTKTVTVDGLGQIAGYEFKVLIESGPSSSSIDAFDSVKYDTATSAPTTISATPTGVSPVKYSVKGGMDSV